MEIQRSILTTKTRTADSLSRYQLSKYVSAKAKMHKRTITSSTFLLFPEEKNIQVFVMLAQDKIQQALAAAATGQA